MKLIALYTLLCLSAAEHRQSVVVVVGAPGTDEYSEAFRLWAGRWQQAAAKADARLVRIGGGRKSEADEKVASKDTADDKPSSDRQRLQRALDQEPRQSAETLWLVLIGHGTFDGKQAKFNLQGRDVSAAELQSWLEPFQRPVAVVNCASSSGPFVARLSAPGRVVVSATKSGFEQNYARFGDYLSQAILETDSDLDKDGQTSLLEAFIAASAGVAEFYRGQTRLATEHAMLDDNGDALATPADWFRGVRAVRSAKQDAPTDGLRANQFHLIRNAAERDVPADWRTRRDALEQQVEALRAQKKELDEKAYYEQLEAIMLQLARHYARLK